MSDEIGFEIAKPMDVTILGVKLGEAAGWDEIETCSIYFYGFVPNEQGLKFLRQEKLPHGEMSISFDFNVGRVEYQISPPLSDPENILMFTANPDWSIFNKEEANANIEKSSG